jgi:hypothetical protein
MAFLIEMMAWRALETREFGEDCDGSCAERVATVGGKASKDGCGRVPREVRESWDTAFTRRRLCRRERAGGGGLFVRLRQDVRPWPIGAGNRPLLRCYQNSERRIVARLGPPHFSLWGDVLPRFSMLGHQAFGECLKMKNGYGKAVCVSDGKIHIQVHSVF